MADLIETNEWPAGVYQIEQTDPVIGGAPNQATGAGMSNIPHQQLAKRTTWLKARVDQLIAAVVPATTLLAGIVRLSASVNSDSTETAATSSAVKAANDNANGRVSAARTVAAGGLATGGGDLSANRTITVPAASQAQAQAGTDNATAMTPLRVFQAVAAWFSGRTVTGSGLASATGALSTGNVAINVPVASAAQAQAGTDNATAMTPLRVAQAVGAQLPAATATVPGVVRLSASVSSSSEVVAASSAAVKAANDNANGRVPLARTVAAGGLATGGGTLASSVMITVPGASEAEAQAGVSDARAMTPLRVMDAIARRTIGWSQTWTAPSRSQGTWYQNTTGCPIMVMIRSDKAHQVRVGPSGSSYVVAGTDGNDMTETDLTIIVPPNHYYMVEAGQEFGQATWLELR